MTAKPLIHIVDDDESLRNSLLRLLRAHGFDAIGYAASGEFLLHRAPDRNGCVLLDIRLPGPSGLELHSVFGEQGIVLPVIFMTGHSDVRSCVTAMKAGAVDYLEKPIEPRTLLSAIQRALRKDEEQRTASQDRKELETAFKLLSRREYQVFEMIVSGKLNKQIADKLGVAERTVKLQRASLMAKLGVSSVAGLGRLAERLRRGGVS
jgi:RNA polymerase sigma factor (sigma-70 family)